MVASFVEEGKSKAKLGDMRLLAPGVSREGWASAFSKPLNRLLPVKVPCGVMVKEKPTPMSSVMSALITPKSGALPVGCKVSSLLMPCGWEYDPGVVTVIGRASRCGCCCLWLSCCC